MRRVIVTIGALGLLVGVCGTGGCVVHERTRGYGYGYARPVYHRDWRAERHYEHEEHEHHHW
jgi:hypothetical protein